MTKQLESYPVTNKLHSDVLEETYGKINVQVLHDDNIIREVLLTDDENIARTYALTIKNNDWINDAAMKEVNEAIQAGEAVGKAFKERGYAIQKNVLEVYLIKLPDWLQMAFGHKSKMAKARIMEFMVKKDDSVFNYGTITEIYSPFFQKPEINEKDNEQINISIRVLQSLGFTNERIWQAVRHSLPLLKLRGLYSSFVAYIKGKWIK